jgi:septum formation protein
MEQMRLILASASPRRAELLRNAGFDFEVLPADVEESPRAGEPADAYTRRVAIDKARHARARTSDPSAAVIAADTEVVAAGRILGKPSGDRDAAKMLRLLSAAAHHVLTAVVISANGQELAEVVTTRVWFAPMSDEEIDWYVATGEPRGKAGGYAIQGHGARFIERIDGSWSNVVGLPIHTVHRMLARAEPR